MRAGTSPVLIKMGDCCFSADGLVIFQPFVVSDLVLICRKAPGHYWGAKGGEEAPEVMAILKPGFIQGHLFYRNFSIDKSREPCWLQNHSTVLGWQHQNHPGSS